MKKLVLALALLLPVSAISSELDNEPKNQERLAQNLPQTLVVRVNTLDGTTSVLHSKEALVPGAADLTNAPFVDMKATDGMNELDGDSSTSGWYFYWYNYNYAYPAYSYYGYQYYYRQYYSYGWANYYYYWYRWY